MLPRRAVQASRHETAAVATAAQTAQESREPAPWSTRALDSCAVRCGARRMRTGRAKRLAGCRMSLQLSGRGRHMPQAVVVLAGFEAGELREAYPVRIPEAAEELKVCIPGAQPCDQGAACTTLAVAGHDEQVSKLKAHLRPVVDDEGQRRSACHQLAAALVEHLQDIFRKQRRLAARVLLLQEPRELLRCPSMEWLPLAGNCTHQLAPRQFIARPPGTRRGCGGRALRQPCRVDMIVRSLIRGRVGMPRGARPVVHGRGSSAWRPDRRLTCAPHDCGATP